MKSLLTFSFSLMICALGHAQTTLPYTAQFDNSTDQNSWKQFKLGQETNLSYWDFEEINQVKDSFALAHYYPVGGSQTTDNWMVSPELDMTKGAIIDAMYYLMKGFGGGSPQPADTIALYYLEGNRDPSLATKKEIVYDYLRTDFKLDNIWYSKSALKIPYKGKSGYLAFRYKTIVNWLDIKVDNIQVSPQKTTDIQPIYKNSMMTVYPNPSKGVIKFKTDVSAVLNVSILDFSGKLILQEKIKDNSELHLEHLPKGVYFVEVATQNQIRTTKLILE